MLETPNDVSVAVVGAGAIGTLLGHTLASAGHRVTMIDLPRRVAQIRRGGLRLVRDGTELRPATIAAGVSFASYGLILQALTTAPVSYVVATRQSSVLFAIAIGAVRWRERPSRLRLLGAFATIAGVALVARSRA